MGKVNLPLVCRLTSPTPSPPHSHPLGVIRIKVQCYVTIAFLRNRSNSWARWFTTMLATGRPPQMKHHLKFGILVLKFPYILKKKKFVLFYLFIYLFLFTYLFFLFFFSLSFFFFFFFFFPLLEHSKICSKFFVVFSPHNHYICTYY